MYFLRVIWSQDIRIYDLISQTSLQSFYHMALIRGLGPNPPTAAYVNNESLTLIAAVDNSIAVMQGRDDDISVLPFATHSRPINAIRYNPLFLQVCHGAVRDISLADKVYN